MWPTFLPWLYSLLLLLPLTYLIVVILFSVTFNDRGLQHPRLRYWCIGVVALVSALSCIFQHAIFVDLSAFDSTGERMLFPLWCAVIYVHLSTTRYEWLGTLVLSGGCLLQTLHSHGQADLAVMCFLGGGLCMDAGWLYQYRNEPSRLRRRPLSIVAHFGKSHGVKT